MRSEWPFLARLVVTVGLWSWLQRFSEEVPWLATVQGQVVLAILSGAVVSLLVVFVNPRPRLEVAWADEKGLPLAVSQVTIERSGQQPNLYVIRLSRVKGNRVADATWWWLRRIGASVVLEFDPRDALLPVVEIPGGATTDEDHETLGLTVDLGGAGSSGAIAWPTVELIVDQ